MSSFICEKCGQQILDTPHGYITGCEHYPMERNMGRDFSFLISKYDPDKYHPMIPDKMPDKSELPKLPDPIRAKQEEVVSVTDKLEGYLLYHSVEINKLVGYLDKIKLESKALIMVRLGLKIIAKSLVFLAKRYKVSIKG